MPKFGLFDRTTGLLEKALDYRHKNHQIIASNVANAHTPGHAPRRFEFEKSLKRSLEGGGFKAAKTHSGHFHLQSRAAEGGDGRVFTSKGKQVVLEQEMMALSENQILFETTTQLVTKKLGLLKYAAQDGK